MIQDQDQINQKAKGQLLINDMVLGEVSTDMVLGEVSTDMVLGVPYRTFE